MLLKIKNMYDCIPVYGGKTFNPPLSGIAHHTYSSPVMDSINTHSMITLELLLVWQGINFLHYVRFSYRSVLTTYLRPVLISSGFVYDLFGFCSACLCFNSRCIHPTCRMHLVVRLLITHSIGPFSSILLPRHLKDVTCFS